MMFSEVDERTYEFAMLRTLGFKILSLVTLLVLKPASSRSLPLVSVFFTVDLLAGGAACFVLVYTCLVHQTNLPQLPLI